MPHRRSSAVRLLALLVLGAVGAAVPAALRAAEPVDLSMMSRIRDEGFHRSQAMDIASNLTDRIGPRLTGSPALRQANDWVLEQFKSWGLANPHLEPFPFCPLSGFVGFGRSEPAWPPQFCPHRSLTAPPVSSASEAHSD